MHRPLRNEETVNVRLTGPAFLVRGLATAHILSLLACVVAPVGASGAYVGSGKEPVYIGSQACGRCHDGPHMGGQFSKWRLSKHAQAFAALSKPEALEITKLSGITEEPHKAKMCLGCHATASEEENWRHGEEFHLADGLQCEACHGPGSEYAHLEIMKSRQSAVDHGLILPDKTDSCMRCHRPKGSHDAVLKRSLYDTNSAWAAIEHKKPTNGAAESKALDERAILGPKETSFKFTGVMPCAECHDGPQNGFIFSKWRLGPHAKAYAALGSTRGLELAKEANLKEHPQHSPQCLKCHSTGYGFMSEALTGTFDMRDGVQCEACHGPGSDYSPKAVMVDQAAARAKGLNAITAKTCDDCHQNAHGKPFEYETALLKIAHPKTPISTAAIAEPDYKNPQNLAMSPDGRELWVTCESSGCVAVVDVTTMQKTFEVKVGGQPHDVTFDPLGKRAFVSNRLDDSVSVIDVAARQVIANIEVGDEPHGVLVDKPGKHLYVLNTASDSISVIDLSTLTEIKRLSASRSPWSLAQSPDGKYIFVTHALSRFVKDRSPSMSEITVIDTRTATVSDRLVLEGANLLQGIAWHPSGEYALVTLLRTKNLVPMTRINHGWTISNGLGIIWRDGSMDQVILDQNNICFPDPIDVCITPDGKHALVTSSSSDRVAIVDLSKMTGLLKSSTPEERARVIPNHTGKSVQFVVKTVPVKAAPRGITVSPDATTAYVANMLDDSITTLDLATMRAGARVDLGGATEITKRRRGEKLFHSAAITFRRQFSCSSCHPDGHIDNIVYDIEDDGVGMGPIDNRTLRGINDMAPYKWVGINPSLKRQCGPRLAVFITRLQPFTPDQLDDLHYYLCSIPRPPNRYRKLGEDLSEAQRRGKAMFERARRNDGSLIPADKRCTSCHPPPLYTDGRVHNVGTKFAYDRAEQFDAPHLLNIYDSAPYLHNGIAWSLEEIWTVYNPNDEHGVTNDMTKDQLNDLIEYLKTL